MVDTVDRATRSRMMAAVRGRDTAIELFLRSALHRRGFRFRKDVRRLPGRPDIVLPKYRAVIFLHGCFWHAHHCPLFRWPRDNAQFWKEKIGTNSDRDLRNVERLSALGWRVLVVWECALRGRVREEREAVVADAAAWIRSRQPYSEIGGKVNNGIPER